MRTEAFTRLAALPLPTTSARALRTPAQAHGHAAHRPPASLWLRVSGVTPGAPSLRGARLEVNAALAALLGAGEQPAAGQLQQPAGQQQPAAEQASQAPGGGGARELLAQRLAEAPSLPAFLVELQNMVDQASLAAALQ